MNNIYFTVGPSQIYPTVPQHIKTAIQEEVLSMNHRGPVFAQLFDEVRSNIKKLMNIPESFEIFFLSSATEGMERIIENVVDISSYHFVNGSFGKRFMTTSQQLGKEVYSSTVQFGEHFNFEEVQIPQSIELICITHCDTSTGYLFDLHEAKKIKKTHPDTFFALDVVSSAPYAQIDFSVFDAVFLSVQKGFGLPSGLGVLILSPQAMEKAEKLETDSKTLGSYHRFSELRSYANKKQTPETPNVFDIYLLNKIAQDMLQKRIENLRTETKEKATMLYDFFDSSETFTPFIEDKKYRSPTIAVVDVEGGSQPVIKKLKEQGIVVGSGYGEFKEKQIRISNFPAHTKEMIDRLLDSLRSPEE